MSFNLNDWYQKNRVGEVVIEYRGVISSELITNLLEVTESKLDEMGTPSKVKRRLYNTLVEGLQNLFHHAGISPAEEDEGKIIGVVLLTKSGDRFTLTTGNYTKFENKKLLSDRIEQINSLSKDELKQLYKMILNNKEFSEKGGGGLGLIDMARKTGNKLMYTLFDYSNEIIFYQLSININ